MKLKLIALAILFVSAVACTQRTCPTYTKDTQEEIKKTEETNRSV